MIDATKKLINEITREGCSCMSQGSNSPMFFG